MNVYLVGMPGSGKSEVGRRLAHLLGCDFVDLDVEVERAAGRTPAQIFDDGGEPGYRAREKRATVEVAAVDGRVVACGGGTVLDPENRELLSGTGRVVWLCAPLDVLNARVRFGSGQRPLLVEDGDLERLLAEREPVYEELADITVDASLDADEVAAAILEALR